MMGNQRRSRQAAYRLWMVLLISKGYQLARGEGVCVKPQLDPLSSTIVLGMLINPALQKSRHTKHYHPEGIQEAKQLSD